MREFFTDGRLGVSIRDLSDIGILDRLLQAVEPEAEEETPGEEE
jgi:hypothetical protein